MRSALAFQLIRLAFAGLAFSSSAHAVVPVRSEATGLATYVAAIREKKVRNVGQLMDLYGGRINVIQRKIPSALDFRKSKIGYRYVYSPRWGWLDLLHFSAGAWTTSLSPVRDSTLGYPVGYRVLKQGEQNERTQQAAGEWSRWDYEDLMSNLMGVFFLEWLDTLSWFDKRDFPQKLQDYLAALGFSDDASTAPNWSVMMETENADDPSENHRYIARFTADDPESLYGEFDWALARFLEGYLKWMGRSREDEIQ